MKDIGLKLKEKREENGVSIDEAAEDLKVRPSQLTSLENGQKENFKDVLFLKYLIRDYAKYLGIDGEKLLDDFNEFLFDFTSKIPLEDIDKANEKKSVTKEFSSPYTNVNNSNNGKIKVIVAIVSLILVVAIISYLVISNIKGNDFYSNDMTYVIRR